MVGATADMLRARRIVDVSPERRDMRPPWTGARATGHSSRLRSRALCAGGNVELPIPPWVCSVAASAEGGTQ